MTPEEELYLFQRISQMADKYIPTKKLLSIHGITFHQALSEAEKWRSNFYNLLDKHNICRNNLFSICIGVIELIEKYPENNDIQQIYCMLITDTGLLFPRGKRGKEITVRSYLRQKENTEKLLQAIADDKALKNQLKTLRSKAKLKPEMVKSDDEENAVYEMTLQHQQLKAGEGNTVYMDNVSALIQQINGNPYMRKVKPYLLFSVLFRKSGYLMKRTAYQANIENLFEYVNYSIEKDNGKNFSDYGFGVELYEHLRRFYMEDKTVDIPLSDYCFANITNLSDWYYRFCEPNEKVPMTLLRKISEFKAPMFPIILTDEIYQGFDIDEFEIKYPVLARKIQKEIQVDNKLIQDFSTTIYNNDDVSRNIVQLCEKVDAYKFSDKKTAYKAAEILLYCEVENRLTDELIFVAENWIK